MPHLWRMYAKLLYCFVYRLNTSDRFKRDFGFELTSDILAIFSLITCSFLLQVTFLNYCPDYGVHYSHLSSKNAFGKGFAIYSYHHGEDM